MKDHSGNYEKTEAQILSDIEAHGVHIAFVDTDGYMPRFGYSIGLYKGFNHPEIMVIGLPPETTGHIINTAKTKIENGSRFDTGVNYDGFLEGYPIQFVDVAIPHFPDYLGFAGWYNDNSFEFPVLQLVWPDKENHYPWEEDFNPNFKFHQPLLDRNTDFKFLEERNLGVFVGAEVLEGATIRYAYHDEDGDWQFHAIAEPKVEDGKLVSLESLVKMDPSLNDIYYLNYGKSAERKTLGSPWVIYNAE